MKLNSAFIFTILWICLDLSLNLEIRHPTNPQSNAEGLVQNEQGFYERISNPGAVLEQSSNDEIQERSSIVVKPSLVYQHKEFPASDGDYGNRNFYENNNDFESLFPKQIRQSFPNSDGSNVQNHGASKSNYHTSFPLNHHPTIPSDQDGSTTSHHANLHTKTLVHNKITSSVVEERKNRDQSDGDCKSGFSVRKSSRKTLKSKNQVEFQEIITNAGGWNSEDQVFQAPCSGIYFFTYNAVSEDGKGFTLALMKNDKYQVTAYGGRVGYQWGSNSAMLFLNPNDKVYLELQEGEIYEHPFDEAYTTFTGFLVKQF